MKWTQRVAERVAHLKHTPGARKDIWRIFLTDSDNEVIVDFVKDDEELYDITHQHFKDRAKKNCLWERFASSQNLSGKVNRLGSNAKGLAI